MTPLGRSTVPHGREPKTSIPRQCTQSKVDLLEATFECAYGSSVDVVYPSFGSIVINGIRIDHDVVVEAGRVRPRKKGPSKPHRSRYGHTPLSPDESIPWSSPRLVVGTGASGRLPIMPEVREQARIRGVELIALPTAEASSLEALTMARDLMRARHGNGTAAVLWLGA